MLNFPCEPTPVQRKLTTVQMSQQQRQQLENYKKGKNVTKAELFGDGQTIATRKKNIKVYSR